MSKPFLKTMILSTVAATATGIMIAIVMPEYRRIAPLIVPILAIPTLVGALSMKVFSEDDEIYEVSRIFLQKFKEAEEKSYLEECLEKESDH